MTARLVLDINDQVIEQARIQSEKQGKTLSKLVEDYLISLAASSFAANSIVDELPKRLKGKINLDIPQNLNEFIGNARYEDD